MFSMFAIAKGDMANEKNLKNKILMCFLKKEVILIKDNLARRN
jgi:hypothetical protein